MLFIQKYLWKKAYKKLTKIGKWHITSRYIIGFNFRFDKMKEQKICYKKVPKSQNGQMWTYVVLIKNHRFIFLVFFQSRVIDMYCLYCKNLVHNSSSSFNWSWPISNCWTQQSLTIFFLSQMTVTTFSLPWTSIFICFRFLSRFWVSITGIPFLISAPNFMLNLC